MREQAIMKLVSGIVSNTLRHAALIGLLPVGVLLAQGTVSGRVTLTEKAGTKTTDLDNSVVWLEPVNGTAPHPRPSKVELAMQARQFAPHVLVVPIGSTVDFPNKDAFSHNIFSTTTGSAFDLGLYGKNQSKDHVFLKTGSIPVYCNVHARMGGFVIVVPTPWYTEAGADGRWSIANVPAGRYTLHIWHERAPEQSQPVTVAAAPVELADAQLDARGFVAGPHKDKFGKDYTGPGQVRY